MPENSYIEGDLEVYRYRVCSPSGIIIFVFCISNLIAGVSSIIFGTRMSTTGGELSKESQKIVDTTVDIVQTLSAIIYSPPWYKLFPTPALKRFDVKLRELHHLAKTLKERRMKEIQEASKNGKQEKDAGFLSQWIANEEMQEDDIQPLVNDMLLAGSDTVSITCQAISIGGPL